MKKVFLFSLLSIFAFVSPIFAQANPPTLELAPAFSEHMVLQQQMPVPVWGWGTPGKKVLIKIQGKSVKTTVQKDGIWHATLPPLKAGGSFEFSVREGNNQIVFQDVLVGEVWICCGQSNMDMGWGGIPEIKKLAQAANQENRPIRAYQVPKMISFKEERRCRGSWQKGVPSSAVAAVFAMRLQETEKVPVGIIQAAWGSSFLEGWMPDNLAKQLPHYNELLQKLQKEDRPILEEMIQIAETNKSHRIEKYSENPTIEAERKKTFYKGYGANVFARTRPNMLYNAMLHPFIPVACRGMVYYQGEANTKSYEDMLRYAKTQRAWLNELRKRWNRPDLYFISVMLPGFGKILPSSPHKGDLEAPDTHSWAIMRDQQLQILSLPHTAVACTIDLGEADNIHPKDKIPVGERIAQIARHETLGKKNLPAYGPMFQKAQFKDGRVEILFQHAKGLHTTDGEAPKAFWLSENGKEWIPATAEIQDEKVILRAPKGFQPKIVRYAYAAKPSVNLVNEADLPAYPFQASKQQK